MPRPPSTQDIIAEIAESIREARTLRDRIASLCDAIADSPQIASVDIYGSLAELQETHRIDIGHALQVVHSVGTSKDARTAAAYRRAYATGKARAYLTLPEVQS